MTKRIRMRKILSFQILFFTVGCLHMFSIHKVKMAVDKHRKQHLHFPAANIGFWCFRKEEKFLGLNFIDSLRKTSAFFPLKSDLLIILLVVSVQYMWPFIQSISIPEATCEDSMLIGLDPFPLNGTLNIIIPWDIYNACQNKRPEVTYKTQRERKGL